MKNTSKKIFIVSNSFFNIYNFRLQLIEYYLSKGYFITLVASEDKYIDNFKELNVKLIKMQINTSKNLLDNLLLIINIFKLLYNSKPDLVITYTLKPNLYFSFVSRILNINYINNFFGLGYLFINRSFLTLIIERFLSFSLRKSKKIFFQNYYDQKHFIDHKIINKNTSSIIPGSGIDINKFYFAKLPKTKNINFILISRLLWDKGIYEYIKAAKNIKKNYMNINFHILGSIESNNPSRIKIDIINEWKLENIVNFHEETMDVREYIRNSHCVVLPSYREGTPKSLLEGMSMGRPIITTDVPGCNHLVEFNSNGYLCKSKDAKDLENVLEKFINLDKDKKIEMGINSRKIVENKYTFEKVLSEYKKVINF